MRTESRGRIGLVICEGSLDLFASESLRGVLGEAIERHAGRTVLDMTGVTYTTSAGIGAIVQGVKHARELGGDVKLAGLTASVRKLFEFSGLTDILHIYDGVDLAVTAFDDGGEA